LKKLFRKHFDSQTMPHGEYLNGCNGYDTRARLDTRIGRVEPQRVDPFARRQEALRERMRTILQVQFSERDPRRYSLDLNWAYDEGRKLFYHAATGFWFCTQRLLYWSAKKNKWLYFDQKKYDFVSCDEYGLVEKSYVNLVSEEESVAEEKEAYQRSIPGFREMGRGNSTFESLPKNQGRCNFVAQARVLSNTANTVTFSTPTGASQVKPQTTSPVWQPIRPKKPNPDTRPQKTSPPETLPRIKDLTTPKEYYRCWLCDNKTFNTKEDLIYHEENSEGHISRLGDEDDECIILPEPSPDPDPDPTPEPVISTIGSDSFESVRPEGFSFTGFWTCQDEHQQSFWLNETEIGESEVQITGYRQFPWRAEVTGKVRDHQVCRLRLRVFPRGGYPEENLVITIDGYQLGERNRVRATIESVVTSLDPTLIQLTLEQYSDEERLKQQKHLEGAILEKDGIKSIEHLLSLFSAFELRDLKAARLDSWPKSTLVRDLQAECRSQLQNPNWVACLESEALRCSVCLRDLANKKNDAYEMISIRYFSRSNSEKGHRCDLCGGMEFGDHMAFNWHILSDAHKLRLSLKVTRSPIFDDAYCKICPKKKNNYRRASQAHFESSLHVKTSTQVKHLMATPSTLHSQFKKYLERCKRELSSSTETPAFSIQEVKSFIFS